MYMGTYYRLNVLVTASNRTVIKAASKKVMRFQRYSRAAREDRHKFYRFILRCHESAQSLVKEFAL